MNSWAYKIDYAVEIAADEKQVRIFENPMLKALCATLTEQETALLTNGVQIQWAELTATAAPELRTHRMEILGYTEEDLQAACAYVQDNAASGTQYRHGEALWLFGEQYLPVCTESSRKTYLAKAKADRARHIRNAKKSAA